MKIDGKQIAATIYAELSKKQIISKRVCFVIFEVSKATEQFVKMKLDIANKLGVDATEMRIVSYDTKEAVERMREVVAEQFDGIVVQLPLPSKFDAQAILNCVPVKQDIDVLSEESKRAFIQGRITTIPPVAFAVWKVLQNTDVEFSTKHIVVVGKGKLVGEPVCALFDREQIAYTAIDISTPSEETKALLLNADIIISGIGKPHFISPHMIKEGVILIDAGTSEQAGKLVGDIDPACYAKASFYTPVPGGIGPLTIAGLYNNLFLS